MMKSERFEREKMRQLIEPGATYALQMIPYARTLL
jgi:hypothetical protein